MTKKPSCTLSKTKETLEKSAPEFEHFDHDLAKTLMDVRNIDADYEKDFVTASDNVSTIAPSQPCCVPKTCEA